MSPRTAPVVETERLRAIRITDTALDGDHVKWFHTNWSDPISTSWSLHGKCNTLEESQVWFAEQISKYDSISYVVFSKTDAQGKELAYPGEVVGNIGLRINPEASSPELPPYPRPAPTSDQTPLEPAVAASLADADPSKPLNLRALGYSFLPAAWGKGYATEAGRAVLDAYRDGTKEAREKGDEVYYVEAIWSPDNAASGKVLGKLGFKTIGYKEEDKVWLAGDWRYGYNVSGLYL